MDQIRIGDLISKLRLENGFTTKKELADAAGVSAASLTRIERNDQIPTPDTLKKLSSPLNTTYGELMSAAGYFEGVSEQQEDYLTNFMNENEVLDNRVFTLIEEIIKYKKYAKNIELNALNILKDEYEERSKISRDIDDIYLKNVYIQGDYSLSDKKNKIEKLENELENIPQTLKKFVNSQNYIHPVPLVGNICAGDGNIAIENIEEFITYPFAIKKQPDFALKVKGDSMIGAGINNGDIVFVKKTSWAQYNGQIVVVILNGEESTLKRMNWSEDSNKFTFSPENPSYQSVEVTPNEFVICGVYAGHFRPIEGEF